MNPVQAWFQRQSKLLSRHPSLEEALLSGGQLRYSWYRLKYVLLRAVLRSVLRLAEVLLFASAFSVDILGPVLLIRSLTLVTSAGWWGALERLRSNVRDLAGHRRYAEAGHSIELWLGLACCLGFLVLSLSGLWVVLGLSPFSSFNVVDVYVLGCGIRLAADLVSRTYHSGIYGLRRVYRPVWSLIAVDVSDVVVLGVLWLYLGPWAMGLSFGVLGIARATLSWHFSKRTYQSLRLAPRGVGTWVTALKRHITRTAEPASLTPASAASSTQFALANLVGQLDSLIVLTFVGASTGSAFLVLASLFHVVAPLQNSAFSWTRLFYFDFKRLETWGSPLLLERFETLLRRLAWIAPVPVGLITTLLMALFWRGPYVELAGLLVVLGFLRGWLALVHLRAFSLADYKTLLRLFLSCAALFVLLLNLHVERPDEALYILTGGLALILLVQHTFRHRGSMLPERSPLNVRLSTWLTKLQSTKTPVRVGWMTLERGLATRQKLKLSLAEHIPQDAITELGTRSLLWFQPADGLSRQELLKLTAGCVSTLVLTSASEDGAKALTRLHPREGAQQSALPRQLAELLPISKTLSVSKTLSTGKQEATLKALQAVIPNAQLLALSSTTDVKQASTAQCLSARELRRAMLSAMSGREGFQRCSHAEVAIIAPGDLPVAAAVVPLGTPLTGDWRERCLTILRRAELDATLAS